jgi:sugar phosphate isomerase/epimerase
MGRGIVHAHIHDNLGIEDEHALIGAGNIDFSSVILKLQEIKYDKVLSFESKSIRDAVKGREIIKEHFLRINNL